MVTIFQTRSIWKMLGPFATASRHTPPVLHCHSPGVATVTRRLLIDAHDNDDDDNNDNAWQRGPLWPHRMGPIIISYLLDDRSGFRRYDGEYILLNIFDWTYAWQIIAEWLCIIACVGQCFGAGYWVLCPAHHTHLHKGYSFILTVC